VPPPVVASAETPAVIATAVACAEVNSRNARASSKKMIWL
jgi:hypothetical protein